MNFDRDVIAPQFVLTSPLEKISAACAKKANFTPDEHRFTNLKIVLIELF